MATNLASKAMLAHLSIGVWGTGKADEEVTAATNNNYGAEKSAGKYTKRLVNKDFLKPIKSIVSAAKAYHNDNTLPWMDRGGRLLPAKNLTAYTEQMRYYQKEFEVAVENFIDHDLANAILDAQSYLGSMFDGNDYPQPEEVKGKFSFEVAIDPVPTEEDFRTSLSENEINQLKEDLRRRQKTKQAAAMQEVRQRIIDILQPFVFKFSDPDAKVYESYITNAEKLADFLPTLNIDEDPEVDKICKDIKERLCSIPVKELRKDKELKQGLADEAMDLMQGYNLTGTDA